jgi:hypothetical protein
MGIGIQALTLGTQGLQIHPLVVVAHEGVWVVGENTACYKQIGSNAVPVGCKKAILKACAEFVNLVSEVQVAKAKRWFVCGVITGNAAKRKACSGIEFIAYPIL